MVTHRIVVPKIPSGENAYDTKTTQGLVNMILTRMGDKFITLAYQGELNASKNNRSDDALVLSHLEHIIVSIGFIVFEHRMFIPQQQTRNRYQ